MSANILVLHGPNLNLLGERPGDEKGRPLEELNGLIRARASSLGISVKIFQSNHEGALIDTLHAERHWANGIVINPGALAHYSYALREALAAVNRPAIEVHLTDIRRRESWRRKSVVKDVCASQVLGKGFDSYLIALERFAAGDLQGKRKSARPMRMGKAEEKPAKKTIGRKGQAAAPAHGVGLAELPAVAFPGMKPVKDGRPLLPAPPKEIERAAPARIAQAKTLGRQAPANRKEEANLLTRAVVRAKIAERLGGKLSPAGLATWARAQWLDVQRGAPAESGQREVLEDSLQSLALSTIPASRLSDDQLVDLMTQLEG